MLIGYGGGVGCFIFAFCAPGLQKEKKLESLFLLSVFNMQKKNNISLVVGKWDCLPSLCTSEDRTTVLEEWATRERPVIRVR